MHPLGRMDPQGRLLVGLLLFVSLGRLGPLGRMLVGLLLLESLVALALEYLVVPPLLVPPWYRW